MSDDQPGSGVTHTVTIRIPPQDPDWTPQSWAEFKEAVKELATQYSGQVIEMTFEPPEE
jgi:hypothetical protein